MITSALLFVLLVIYKLTFLKIKLYQYFLRKLKKITDNWNEKMQESSKTELKLLKLMLDCLYKIDKVYYFFTNIDLFILKTLEARRFRNIPLIFLIAMIIGIVVDMYLLIFKFNMSLTNFTISIIIALAILYAMFYKKGYKRLILVLCIQPIALTFVLMVLIAKFYQYVIPSHPVIANYMLFGSVLFFPTIVSIALYFYYMKRNRNNFEIDLPVAVEFNSTVAVIFVGASWFYLWSIGDIKSLLTPEITQFLVTGQTSLKDGLINYSRVVSLPFLFSNGVLKFLIQRQKFLSTVRRKT